MMIAPTLKNIIVDNAEVLGIDPNFVYCYSIDPTVRNSEISETVILINEMSDDPDYYGSDFTLGRKARGQVQIFYAPDFMDDTDMIRENLMTVLENEGWYLFNDTGIARDPDVEVLYSTQQYQIEYDRRLTIK